MQTTMPNTEVVQAAVEMIEDNFKQVVQHAQDATVNKDKPSKIVIEIEVKSNQSGDQFSCKVAGKTTLAPHKAHEAATIYAGIDDSGKMTVAEYSGKLPFDAAK